MQFQLWLTNPKTRRVIERTWQNDRPFGRSSTTNSSSPALAYSPEAFLRLGRLAFFAAVRCFFAAISIGTMSGVSLPS